MEDLRKEIKRKFDLLNPIQLGLIGYWYKLSKDDDFNCVYNKNTRLYLKRIKEILKEVE